MMRYVFVLCAAALVTLPAWAVNKCSDPDGRVTYQEKACTGSGSTVVTNMDKGVEKSSNPRAQAKTSFEEQMAARDAADRKFKNDQQDWWQVQAEAKRKRLVNAESECGSRMKEDPSVGMTESDFQNCTRFGLYFEADKVNETEAGAGVTKQFVYRTTHPIRFVYTRNGVVTAIQR